MKLVLVISGVLFSTLVLAQSRGNKSGGSSGSSAMSSWRNFGGETHEFEVNLSKAEFHNYKAGNNSYSEINIYGAYNRLLKDSLQIGGEGGILSMPDGTSTKTVVALMGVATYNLSSDLAESFFGNVGIGLLPAADRDTAKYDSKISFMFSAGKRFPVWGHVSYKPFVRVLKRGDMDVEFLIQAANFSFMF